MSAGTKIVYADRFDRMFNHFMQMKADSHIHNPSVSAYVHATTCFCCGVGNEGFCPHLARSSDINTVLETSGGICSSRYLLSSRWF